MVGGYSKKACVELYCHCDFLKNQNEGQNVGKPKTKTDIKCYENLEAICHPILQKTSKRKHYEHY